jgi:hypothetical protein
MLPSTATGVIALLCQPGMESAWRTERRATSSFHASFAPPGSDGYSFMAALPRDWAAVPEWGDWPHLIAWRHNPDHAVLTYCEGDLSVEVADDHTAYLELLRRTTAELAQSDADAERFLTRLEISASRQNHAGSAALEGAE